MAHPAGPASYSLPQMMGSNTVVTSAAPTFSFCGRNKIGTFHEDLKKVCECQTTLKILNTSILKFSILVLPLQTPGPAAYNVVDTCIYRHKPPQISMKGRNFPPGETTKKPGPGAHHPEHVRNIFDNQKGLSKEPTFCSIVFLHWLYPLPR